jgi:hypothetical protein
MEWYQISGKRSGFLGLEWLLRGKERGFSFHTEITEVAFSIHSWKGTSGNSQGTYYHRFPPLLIKPTKKWLVLVQGHKNFYSHNTSTRDFLQEA